MFCLANKAQIAKVKVDTKLLFRLVFSNPLDATVPEWNKS